MKFLTFIALLFIVSLNTMAQLKYIAHRGASYYAPENSLSAFKLAWELGSDGAECDIQLTGDNQIVIWHDKDTERLTGQKLVISQTPYSELEKLKIKLSPTNSSCFEGEKIPLLKDVLKILSKDQLLVIEIKCGKEIFPELQKAIKKNLNTVRIAFIAFDFETICLAKSNYPEVPCYYLSSSKEDVLKRIPDIKKYKLDGVDLNSKIIDQQLADELSKIKAEIWCWTVDTIEEATRMKDIGVMTITTNRPNWLKEQINSMK